MTDNVPLADAPLAIEFDSLIGAPFRTTPTQQHGDL